MWKCLTADKMTFSCSVLFLFDKAALMTDESLSVEGHQCKAGRARQQ